MIRDISDALPFRLRGIMMSGRINYRVFIILILLVFLSVGHAAAKMTVFVSIPPQEYIVQQIGKNLVDVNVMVEPGADPHTFEPKPRQMVAVSRAALYFAIGVEFEKARLEKIAAANPNMRVVHTDHGIRKIPMAAVHHEEDAEGHHGNGHPDPHIWLSPPLVLMQARMVLEALQASDPTNYDAYGDNYKAFAAKVIDLDLQLSRIFSGKRGLQFMVFHPSWGYFAHTYGIRQVPVEVEGKTPKPAQLRELIEHARENDITVIFAQPQFSAQSAKLVASEIGGEVVFADPLAEDWMRNMEAVADKFKRALK